MKKILTLYPSVFYQILLLFILGEIVFSCCSFDLSPLYDLLDISGSNNYKPLTTITLYIVAGIIVDQIRDFRKGILLATILFAIGFLFTSLGFESSHLPYLIGGIICKLGHCIFVILCVFHVGLLFPIANDWKDMAFMFLMITPFSLDILSTSISGSISHTGGPITINDSLSFLLFFLAIGLIFYFLNNFKDLGFKIEIIKEGDTEEELKEEKYIRNSMIGCVLVALVFSFITKKLPDLELLQPSFTELIYSRKRLPETHFFVIIFSIFIFGFSYFRTSKYQSRHSKKILIVAILLLLLGGLEYFSVARNSDSFYLASLFIFYLIIIPMILSIMTHINLDRNIGLWLGVFFAMPFVVDQLTIFLHFQRIKPEVLPYASVLLLFFFLITFKLNQKFIEKELALNEPNREDDVDDEEGIDILEHFIEK